MPAKPNLRALKSVNIGLPKMLLTIDMFRAPLPVFRLQGRESVRTHCGGCMTLLIMYVSFLFAIQKLQHLIAKHNPAINVFVEQAAFDERHVWRGSENDDFMMAFAVVDYVTG